MQYWSSTVQDPSASLLSQDVLVTSPGLRQNKQKPTHFSPPPLPWREGEGGDADAGLSCVCLVLDWSALGQVGFCFVGSSHTGRLLPQPAFCAVTEPVRKCTPVPAPGEPRAGRQRDVLLEWKCAFLLRLPPRCMGWRLFLATFSLCACTTQKGHVHRDTLPKCAEAGSHWTSHHVVSEVAQLACVSCPWSSRIQGR